MKEIDYKTLKNRKIVITGGLGFVGVNLVKRLLKNGIQPVVLDIMPEDTDFDTKYIPFKSTDVKYFKIDITNKLEVNKTINDIQPNYLIHLAAMTNLTKDFKHARSAVDVNIHGTLNLLEASYKQNIDSFILLSSSDVYGEVEPPFKESQRTLPASPYSVSKASAEMYSLLFNRIYNIPVTILRSFNVFGKYQKSNRIIPFIISSLLKQEEVKLTPGEQKREFNYISNLIDAILLSLTCKNCIGEIINIGNGQSITIKALAEHLSEKMNRKYLVKLGAIPYRENEIWDMYCDNSKALKMLQWEPRISIEEGLRETIEWFKQYFS